MTKHKGMKTTAWLLLVSMTVCSLPAQATMISTVDALAPLVQTESAQRSHIAEMLARDDVRAGLARYGVSADQAAARVALMSDDEVLKFSQRMDTTPAGGDIIGAVVFVFLVLLVTDILGFTKIFPFTRSIR